MDPEEQLAKMFHDSYEELAPLFGYKTRTESAVPWEQVPENNRKLMISTAKLVLAAMYDGKLDPPGVDLTMLVSAKAEQIRVDFSKNLKWFAMPRENAINFAITILQHCNVPVNIAVTPPAAPESRPV